MTLLTALNEQWLSLAREGRFEKAWTVSDQALRLRAGIDCSQWPRHHQFIWDGRSLVGRRVLIRCYHGLGDTIQFVRFVPAIRQIAREVILWVQPKLVPLLLAMNCADRVLPLHDGMPNVEYDVDVELFELAHVLRPTSSELASTVPYIRVGDAPFRATRLPRRVGLVWAAGEWDCRRSIPSDSFASFGSIPGVDWYLVQRGPALSSWANSFGHVPAMATILDEARVLGGLDLLITVDTCSAHLAGALGVPVWTLLHADADWRWMHGRDDSPWYPSMRLFRQRSAGSWDPVLEDVRAALWAQLSP